MKQGKPRPQLEQLSWCEKLEFNFAAHDIRPVCGVIQNQPGRIAAFRVKRNIGAAMGHISNLGL